MKKFIAYFDYLGFKEFIEKNDLEAQMKVINRNFRDMELALGQGNYRDEPHGFCADTSNSRIKCINFSDTVVFFTNDNEHESLIEFLDVVYEFNRIEILNFFPLRGAIAYGEMVYKDFKSENKKGGMFNVNSVYGKSLVQAHAWWSNVSPNGIRWQRNI